MDELSTESFRWIISGYVTILSGVFGLGFHLLQLKFQSMETERAQDRATVEKQRSEDRANIEKQRSEDWDSAKKQRDEDRQEFRRQLIEERQVFKETFVNERGQWESAIQSLRQRHEALEKDAIGEISKFREWRHSFVPANQKSLADVEKETAERHLKVTERIGSIEQSHARWDSKLDSLLRSFEEFKAEVREGLKKGRDAA